MKTKGQIYYPPMLVAAIALTVSCSNPQPASPEPSKTAETRVKPAEKDTTAKEVKPDSTAQTARPPVSKTLSSKPAVKPDIDLHTAVMTNNINAVKQHIAARTDLNSKDPVGGSTPLITAALFGKTEIAQLLIDAGAGLNIQNNDGSTALFTAAFFCRTEIVKKLLARNADKSIRNKYGQTALEALQTPFEQVKPVYDILGNALAPMGLTIDYAHIEKTRPVIAEMLSGS